MRHFAEFAEPEFPYDDSIPEETEEELDFFGRGRAS